MKSHAADYIVVRDGKIVQEISALGAANAEAAVTEHGQLYVKVREENAISEAIDAFLDEALPS